MVGALALTHDFHSNPVSPANNNYVGRPCQHWHDASLSVRPACVAGRGEKDEESEKESTHGAIK